MLDRCANKGAFKIVMKGSENFIVQGSKIFTGKKSGDWIIFNPPLYFFSVMA